MTPERWREVEKIFYAALELDRDQRADFIAKSCAEDPELIREVESLLASNEEAEHIGLLNFTEDSIKTKTLPVNKSPATVRTDSEPEWRPDPTTELIVRRNQTKQQRFEALKSASGRTLKLLLAAPILTAIVLGSIWFAARRNAINRVKEPKTNHTANAQGAAQNRDRRQPANIKFKKISIDQGLSQNTVYGMIQDSQGFMWFGTLDGLNRYDGYEFTTFRHNPKDSGSLSSNFISALFEDRSGIIWIGTGNGGVNRYDPARQTFARYSNNKNNPNSLGNDNITALCGDGENTVWVGTSWGLHRLDVKTGDFTAYLHDEKNAASISSNYIASLFQDRDGALWIGTADQGLNRLNVKTGIFSSYKHDEKDGTSISGNYITAIFQDREGAIWIGTAGGGLDRYDAQTGSFIHYSYYEDSGESERALIKYILQDRAGIFWIGAAAGLYRFDPVSRTSALYRHDPRDSSSIGNNRVNVILEDQAGAIWIGSTDGGADRYDPIGEKFAPVRIASIAENISGANNTTSIYKDRKGKIWIGTADSGLYRYDPADRSLAVYRHKDGDPNSLSNDKVRALCADGDGNLWIGTSGGLNIYDLEKDRFIPQKSFSEQLSIFEEKPVLSIFRDRSQTLWIGAGGVGLAAYDKKSRTFELYKKGSAPQFGLSSDRISAICRDRAGAVWVGTVGSGLNRYDPASRNFTVYKNEPGNPTSIASNRVTSICEDREGSLWFGTTDGLNKYDPATNSFATFTKSDGLPNDFVYGVLEDQEGRLWLSTNKGLSRFDPKNKSFKNYDAADGLQSNEFNLGAYCKSDDGELFFGGINGINGFYPERIKENAYMPPVRITSFKALEKNGKQVFSLNSQPTADKPIAFPYNHNFFEFEFVALNYTHPEKNRYAIKLEGVDGDWIDSGSKRYARYADLAPGEYLFKVRGSNNDGVWNYESAEIGFMVAPPLWKTWWAYIFYIAVLTISIYSMHRYRLHLLEERNRMLEARVIERTDEVNRKKEELEKKNLALVVKNSELVESHKRADRIFSALAEALPGTTLDGKYRLEEKIGSGGFGTVYRAEHLAMKRAVAVKVFKPVPGNDSAEALERFMREAVSACRVNHPNAVAVLDSGISADGIAYLVMELLDGRSLTSEMRESKVLRAERCAQILLPVCSALAKAHSIGIVHRDIKPDNIFLHRSEEGETVKVVDFGIAKLVENGAEAQFGKLTFTGGLIGTPLYISPERLTMNDYDGRADVYSLGVVLYEMLCGNPPFSSEDGGLAMIAAQITKEPPSLRERNPLVTAPMERVVMKALEKDPAKRLTAMELAEEFDKAVKQTAKNNREEC